MDIYRVLIALFIIEILTMGHEIHIMQLNSYNFDQQILWYIRNINKYILYIILFLSSLLMLITNFFLINIIIYIVLLAILIENLSLKQKKKLVFTHRIYRLIVTSFFLFILGFLPLIIFKNTLNINYGFIITSLSPIIVFIAYLINMPIENFIKSIYINKAKEIIKNSSNLKVLGITGSFGKTSVKHFVTRLLKLKYNTTMTPESYNTPMGVTLTIRNNLNTFDEFFVCEMGARRVGDIRELCEIAKPSDCILTEVKDQHLDTFYNIGNVLKTKFELVDYVLEHDDSLILLNGDNDLIVNNIKNNNILTYGFNSNNDFFIKKVECDNTGSKFTIKCRDYDSLCKKFQNKLYIDSLINNKENLISGCEFETKLLGEHNIKNLLVSIVYALLNDIDISLIKKEVSKIDYINHRLELKKINENTLLIDDAYNSNIIGAISAIDVLDKFVEYKKIVISPGMVELLDKQYDINKKFIKYALDKVDLFVAVSNTNKKAFLDGFNECSNEKKHIEYFDKFSDAFSYVKDLNYDKKIILLENDLPDNY